MTKFGQNFVTVETGRLVYSCPWGCAGAIVRLVYKSSVESSTDLAVEFLLMCFFYAPFEPLILD